MKNLIIGACSDYDWPQIAPWVNSINKCGFEGDKIMIVFRGTYDTVMKLFDHGFQAIVFNRDETSKTVSYVSPNRVHVERFIQIYNYLKDTWQNYEYVITTDTRDVVFQTDPVTWLRQNLGDKKLVAATEAVRFRDESWNRDNLFQTYGPYLYEMFKDKEVYNVGTIAGRAEAVKDLMLNIYSNSVGRLASVVDQSVYNMLINCAPYRDGIKFMGYEEAWALQAGVIADPPVLTRLRPFLTQKEPLFEGGLVRNAEGKIFSIVHQYDRVPIWKEHFLKEYGA